MIRSKLARTAASRFAEMAVEGGEIGQFAGPRQQVEEAARRFLRLERARRRRAAAAG